MPNIGVWVGYPGTRQINVYQPRHAFPGPARSSSLTAAANLAEPEFRYLFNALFQAVHVAWDGMIIQPSS